jgi:hypothetical protein
MIFIVGEIGGRALRLLRPLSQKQISTFYFLKAQLSLL